MNRMFDDFFRASDLAKFEEGEGWEAFSPAIDVKQDEKEVTVKAELPGMDEKGIEVSLSDQGLAIRGEKKAEKEEKGKHYWRREASYGAFSRLVPLPEGLDLEKVDARFRNGILTVTLPRREEARDKEKKIAIKAG
jgi:HSP20 family protein